MSNKSKRTQKKLYKDHEKIAEHLFQKEQRKKLPDNPILKVNQSGYKAECKNEGCGKLRRHGSAYCGQCQ